MTEAEIIFMKRMLPHFLSGKSVEESARAVLDDDARLFTTFCDRASDHYVPGYNDHTGRTHRTREGKGDLIVSEISKTVYQRLRSLGDSQ